MWITRTQSKTHLRKLLLLWTEYFIEGRHKFSQIYEMNITTIRNKKHMASELFVKQPMQMIELNLKKIIDDNPHLMNALDRGGNYPLVRNFKRNRY